jgi:hypothetical protein
MKTLINIPAEQTYSPDRDDYVAAEELRAALGWGTIFLADHYDTVEGEVRRGAFELEWSATEPNRVQEGINRSNGGPPGYEHYVYRTA